MPFILTVIMSLVAFVSMVAMNGIFNIPFLFFAVTTIVMSILTILWRIDWDIPHSASIEIQDYVIFLKNIITTSLAIPLTLVLFWTPLFLLSGMMGAISITSIIFLVAMMIDKPDLEELFCTIKRTGYDKRYFRLTGKMFTIYAGFVVGYFMANFLVDFAIEVSGRVIKIWRESTWIRENGDQKDL